MSLTGLIAIIILIAAALLGVVLYARNRGRLNGSLALVAALVIIAVASVTLLYPSFLTTTHVDKSIP